MTPRPLLLGMGWFPDQTGGLNRYLRTLAEALRAEDVDARAVVIGPAEGAPGWVRAVSRHRAPLPLRMLAFARAARGGDVIDTHFALYALLPVLLRRRTPVVTHFQGPFGDEELAQRGRAGTARIKTALERRVLARATTVITLTPSFRRMAALRYGVPSWRSTVVAPGVDLERFSPGDRDAARAQLGLAADDFVAVTARRLVPRMGIDVLLDAWRTRENGTLLVVGEGPERAALEARAGERVRFLGRVDDDTLLACYRAADVAVVPTRSLEGFGLVCLEALACGTPVVASDVDGLRDALADFDPGLLVPPEDVTALAARISEPLPSRDGCRAYAERFRWDEVARRHIEIYRDAVESRAPARRRVVYVGHSAQQAGGEIALARLVGALDDVDAHVVLAEDGPLVDTLHRAGATVEVLPMRESVRGRRRDARSLPLLGSALYTLRLARRLRALAPDLVHTNTLKANLYGGVAAKLAHVPVVWHVRDRIADDYLPPRVVRLVRALARRVPNAVIANSRATLATVPGARAPHVVPSPVGDVQPAGRRNAPLRIGMVGRIAPWKGQHVFLEAFARAFPDGEAEAVVVGAPLFGADEVEYERELRALARERGIDRRVDFAGFREDVAAELAGLDVLVHASTVPEPFGLVVAEGMAAGLAVVAANAGGPAEVVEHDVNGLVFQPGNSDELAAALRRLAADAELRTRLGGAARERAAAFAPAAVAARVREIYDAVLS